MLELSAGDKIRVVSLRSGDEMANGGQITDANESYLTIQSMSISNPPLEADLVFVDVVQGTLIKNMPESLSFVDTVETVKDARFSLTESLLFTEDPLLVDNNGQVVVSFLESLSLVDTLADPIVQPLKPTESLTFVDVLDTDHSATITLTESLSFDDGSVSGIPFVPANPDFKVQHGVFTDGANTFDLVEGNDFDECVGDCFIMHVGTRHTGMGEITGGASRNLDDWTSRISDDAGLRSGDVGNTVTFEKSCFSWRR